MDWASSSCLDGHLLKALIWRQTHIFPERAKILSVAATSSSVFLGSTDSCDKPGSLRSISDNWVLKLLFYITHIWTFLNLLTTTVTKLPHTYHWSLWLWLAYINWRKCFTVPSRHFLGLFWVETKKTYQIFEERIKYEQDNNRQCDEERDL